MRHCRFWVLSSTLLLLLAWGQYAAGQPAPTTGTIIETDRLRFVLPADWRRADPSSKMRLVQATIPGVGGPGELAVFYFGPGQGGGVDANLQRWIAQMELPPDVIPKPERFEANGCTVTWIDVAGTLKPSAMGMGPSSAQPGSRLLGAVVEGPGGPWFFKATGPDKTLGPEREKFSAMLKSVQPR